MDIKKTGMGLVCFILACGIQVSFSQVITSVPSTTANSRFFNEIYPEMKRPGLSVVGFDNGGNYNKGYGLKQILNQVYSPHYSEQKELFKKIINHSGENEINFNPPDAGEIEANSNILQYLAFEALCSFVLEQNGITSQISNNDGIPIRDHNEVIDDFTFAINELLIRDKLTAPGTDYVKHVNTYTNIARAIDLYLALENALSPSEAPASEDKSFEGFHFHLAEWS